MNSLLYLGDSERAARKAFREARAGFRPWGQADDAYGVTLSRWNARQRDFEVIAKKFLEQA